MAISYGIMGLKEVEDTLRRLGSADTRRRANLAGARVLVSDTMQAFTQPAFRPAPWPPLAASTLGRAGASSKGAKEARAKAKEWHGKATALAAAGAGLSGKKLEANLKKSAAAAKKAKEWKAKAKTAASKAAGSRQPLMDTKHLYQSISLKADTEKAGVTSDAKAKKSDFPYAVVHQYGSRTVPARPFIPVKGSPGNEQLSEREKTRILAAVEAELRKIAAGR
ncbi:MAG: hypothetical protein IJ783_06060 [Kiritimatiellae bacterium]|nr:hypothetical protein [Kiritimatiellia bacterium]